MARLDLTDERALHATGRALLRLVETPGPMETPCWIWPGHGSHDGYGRIGSGVKEVGCYVHVAVYRALVGPIPDGLQLDHLCRVRRCANPAHLEVVTQRENIMRGEGFAARKARQTHCVRGHEFTEASTRVRKNGSRQCRACEAERSERKVA